MRRKLWLIAWTLVMVLSIDVVAAAAAQAQPALPAPDARDVKAREMFGVGRYAEALEIFGRLYAETNHPTYLRNVGRCYQNLGEPEKAIASFREYLRQAKNLASDQRALVDGYIKEMEELKRQRAREHEPAPAANASAPPPPPQPRAAPGAGSPQPSAEEATRRPRRMAAYGVAAVSLAALGVGGYFGLRAVADKNESDRLCPMSACDDDRAYTLNSQARTEMRVADVALGAGLAGAGVATYLLLTSGARGEEARKSAAARVQVWPALGRATSGLVVGGAW